MTERIDPKAIAKALEFVFVFPNETDRNFEAANVVDGLFDIARAIRFLGNVLDYRLAAEQARPTRFESSETDRFGTLKPNR